MSSWITYSTTNKCQIWSESKPFNFHRNKKAIINAANHLNIALIHKLSSLSRNGCTAFYMVLKAREWSGLNTSERERKWQEEFGTHFSIDFCNKIWILKKLSIVSKKTKWINPRIFRFTLPKNYSVNKYKPFQDQVCSFCIHHLEWLPFLIRSSPGVRGFWGHGGDHVRHLFPKSFFG